MAVTPKLNQHSINPTDVGLIDLDLSQFYMLNQMQASELTSSEDFDILLQYHLAHNCCHALTRGCFGVIEIG